MGHTLCHQTEMRQMTAVKEEQSHSYLDMIILRNDKKLGEVREWEVDLRGVGERYRG